jgi:hypothetical protein
LVLLLRPTTIRTMAPVWCGTGFGPLSERRGILRPGLWTGPRRRRGTQWKTEHPSIRSVSVISAALFKIWTVFELRTFPWKRTGAAVIQGVLFIFRTVFPCCPPRASSQFRQARLRPGFSYVSPGSWAADIEIPSRAVHSAPQLAPLVFSCLGLRIEQIFAAGRFLHWQSFCSHALILLGFHLHGHIRQLSLKEE